MIEPLLALAEIDGSVIAAGAMIFGGFIALFVIATSTVQAMQRTKHREETKRELAAYVAEGSMTPDEAERLLKAEPKKDD
jgi:predicted aspartyl protease